MRALLALTLASGVVLIGVGTATILAAHRLAALAPGGVAVERLSYNPFTGALHLAGVHARDRAGRIVFTSPRIAARVGLGGVLTGQVALRGLDVMSPRFVVASSSPDGVALTDGGVWPVLNAPLTVEGVMVTDGTLLVRDPGSGRTTTLARGIDVRLDRLEAASPRGWIDAAFLVQMTAYGSTVQLTGRPSTAGDYALRVRARDADLAAWLRDFPLAGVTAPPGARGEIDATVTVTSGRAQMSGVVRAGPLAVVAAPAGRMRARAVHLVFDGVDLTTREGRISTVHVQSPTVTLVTRGPDRVLDETREILARLAGSGLRRLTVADGDVTLVTPSGKSVARMVGVTVGMDARGRYDDRDLVVSVGARVGRAGRVSVRGILRPGEGSFDGDVQLADVALAGLGAPLVSAAGGSEGALSFNGHVRVADIAGATSASLAGARMTWTAPVRRDFRADALTVSLRRYEWPRGFAVIDSLTLTRPAWSTLPLPSSGVSIDDAGVVVTQSVAEPTPLDGLLAAVETASRAYQAGADFPAALPRVP